MRWWKADIGSLGEQFQIVGELICFNVWYHILSYRCTYIYIYISIYIYIWFPTEFKEYNIVYMILLPIDGMEVHWQCMSWRTQLAENLGG
jgi:hypothetical protein